MTDRKSCTAAMLLAWCLVLAILVPGVSGQAGDCRCKEKLNNGMGYLLCGACSKTWEAANTYCADQYQGQLALITDPNIQEIVQGHLEDNRASDVWIGARGSVDNWHWLHNRQTIAYQGCFQDDPTNRDLNFDVRLTTVTPDNCIEHCKQNGYKYAGLQAGSLCFCGNTFGKHGYNTIGCSNPCSGDFNLNCGGGLSNDVYSVDGSWSSGWVFGSPSSGSGGIDDKECMVYKCESFFGWSWQNERCERKFRYLCMFDYDNSTCIARGLTPTAETCISYPDTDPVSWFNAKTACQEEGGRLLELRSALSHWAIRDALSSQCTLDTLWLGATKVNWEWANGATLKYTNWATSRPTNGGDKCVAMSFKLSRIYEWSDLACDQNLNFVCERPTGPRTTTTTTTTTTTPTTTTTTTATTTTTTQPTTRRTTTPTTTTTTTTTLPSTRRTTETTQRTVTPPTSISTRLDYSTEATSTVASSSRSSTLVTEPSSTVTYSSPSTAIASSTTETPGPPIPPVPTRPPKPTNGTTTPPPIAEDGRNWIPIYIGIAVAVVFFVLIVGCIIYACYRRCGSGGEKKATMRVENGYSNRAGFVHDGDFAYKTPGGTKNGGFTGSEQPSRPPYVAAVTPNNASRAPPISVVPPTPTAEKDVSSEFPDNMTSTVTSASSARDDDGTSGRSSVSSSSSVYIGELDDQGVDVKYVHPRDQSDPSEVKPNTPTPKPEAGNQATLPIERKLTGKGPAPAPPKSAPPKDDEKKALHTSQIDISTRL